MNKMREAFEKFKEGYKNGATGTHYFTVDVFEAGYQPLMRTTKRLFPYMASSLA